MYDFYGSLGIFSCLHQRREFKLFNFMGFNS